MDDLREADLAWDLVDRHRSVLTIAELNAVFMRLGVGEYMPVIRDILKAVVRDSDSLSLDMVRRLDAWVHLYDGHEHSDILRHLLRLAGPRADRPRLDSSQDD